MKGAGKGGGHDGGATNDGASSDMPRDVSDGRVSGFVMPSTEAMP